MPGPGTGPNASSRVRPVSVRRERTPVTAPLLAGRGDELPVSALPVDGTFPTATSQWEKRNVAISIPIWDEQLCIQCNKCALVCPHAAIRVKVYPPEALDAAPPTFKHVPFKSLPGSDPVAGDIRRLTSIYTVQVAPEDCTGCELCVMMCPAKDKADPAHRAIVMAPQAPLREAERANYAFFLDLPEADRTRIKPDVKSTQFLEPLFEFSGACSGAKRSSSPSSR